MLTGKQKRYLRSLATVMDPIFQVGKGGLNENMINQLIDALEARELIKVRLLSNSDGVAKEVAAEIALGTSSEVVQVIGNKMVFYRRSTKKPRLELP